MTRKLQGVIVTGMSGAGKSVAIQHLEDLGFFSIDNIPPQLATDLYTLIRKSSDINKVAMVTDLRSKELYDQLESTVANLRKDPNLDLKVIFLDASDEELVTRYKETRRAHPLSKSGTLLENIKQERKLNKNLKNQADLIIDTTTMSPNKLKYEIDNLFKNSDNDNFQIDIMSFGYKYGIPLEADVVFDVRFMPNPFYDEKLKVETGENQKVVDYVMADDKSQEFVERLYSMIDFLVPQYKAEGKSTLTIAIGCTGGQHRSVTVANKLSNHLKQKKLPTMLYNRDMAKSQKAVKEHE